MREGSSLNHCGSCGARSRFHLKRLAAALLIFGILGALGAARAEAQEADAYGNELSLHTGSFLPNQIEGVTEILPMWGARYGIATGLGVLDTGFATAHAQGVDFLNISESLRGDFPLADQIYGMVYGGLDFNYYTQVNQTNRENVWGVHMGTGIMVLVANTMWLRSDLKFMGGPGTSLYLGFGVVFRAPGSGGGGSQ